MTTKQLCLLAALGAAATALPLTAAPRGGLVELHSCEVFTGGCIASSEAPQGGRMLLRVWAFEGGVFRGADLTGLHAALLETADENLATADSVPSHAIAYLPAGLSPTQEDALRHWLAATEPRLAFASLPVVHADVVVEKTADGLRASVGPAIHFAAHPLQQCDLGGCGQQLWYEPRSAVRTFCVLANAGSAVREDRLQLTWDDNDKRSVFVATFGDAGTVPDFCDLSVAKN